MNRKQILGFNDLKFAPVFILLLGMLTPVMFFGNKPIKLPAEYFPNAFISTIMTAIYYFSGVEIIMRMRRKYPAASDLGKRLFWQVIYAAIIIAVVQTVIIFLMQNVFTNYNPARIDEPTGVQALLASAFLTLLTMSIYEIIYLFQKYKEAEIAREKLQRINLQSQLDTLKNQVNPHFLFNSLNTLTSLIPEDPKSAIRFVEKLSQTYRHILAVGNEKLIPLRAELRALDAYVYLLKIRFGDKIIIDRDVPAAYAEDLILPLSLQMLMENAVKHNVVSAAHPLHIRISVQDNFLIVRNNLQLKKQQFNSTKVGLANIKARYELLGKKEVKVRETEGEFLVELPLLK